jgi:peptidoglycan/xylan/chitin deacetylase (PgdA/CDA1 family)
MNRTVKIVMYHYVRDLEHSHFPAIKGLSLERFRRQLDFIKTHYAPITAEDLLETLSNRERELPPNSILLTFDDGYRDHFLNVFPLLHDAGIKGCFFPSAQPVLDHVVMDVNKIQFVLAAVPNIEMLLEEVFRCIDELRPQHSLMTKEQYLQLVTEKHRYDPHEVILFKRLLQRDLPAAVRAEIVRRLFARYVTMDEAAFACELYMSVEQMACLRADGMHIGSHGHSHAWLNHISREMQAAEIDQSLAFLRMIGDQNKDWSMCYPYGGFNDSLLEVLRDRHCSVGFTVEARIADLNVDDCLTLPRVDTNDLPS